MYFLDRTHGKLIRELLTSVGLQVTTHRTRAWAPSKPDAEWIAECGAFNWVIISGDKNIERIPEERQAVINGKCKVFVFDDSHITRTEDWAASFLVGRHRIVEIINKADGPFFVTLKPCRVRGHIGLPRFVSEAGGGWKKPEQTPAPVPATIPVVIKGSPRQQYFDFTEKPK